MFEELNFRYFHGLMARPMLGWSPYASRTMLGHYDPSHNAIVLSRILDRAETPRLAVEYVLFHEMLHLRHPAEHIGARGAASIRGSSRKRKSNLSICARPRRCCGSCSVDRRDRRQKAIVCPTLLVDVQAGFEDPQCALELLDLDPPGLRFHGADGAPRPSSS